MQGACTPFRAPAIGLFVVLPMHFNCLAFCTLTKKARKTTAVQYKAKRILSVYAEPGGLCAMTSPPWNERPTQRRNGDVAIFGQGRISRDNDTPVKSQSER